MNPPRILISIPNTGWIHRSLVERIPALLSDNRYLTKLITPEQRPVENNMEMICRRALQEEVDYLLTIDSDTVPLKNPLDLVALDVDIAHCPYPLLKMGHGCYPLCWSSMDKVPDGYVEHNPKEGLQEVDAVGAGCTLIARRVLVALEGKGSWVRRWENGLSTRGSDFSFCAHAKEVGFRIWTHYDYPAEHYKQVGLIQLTEALSEGE